jgi:integrase
VLEIHSNTSGSRANIMVRGHSKSIQKTNQLSYYQRFLDSLSSPQTRSKYDSELKRYLQYLNISDPNKLITSDLIDSPTTIRQAEDQIIEYLKHLANAEKLARASIDVRLAAILYFYNINRVNIQGKYVSRFKPPRRKIRKGDYSYTHEQINVIIGKASTRDKMIILLMASTGMRIGALSTLTIDNLYKVKVEGYPFYLYKIIVYEGEPEEYYTFTTFECTNVIDDYLREREHFGEQLNKDAPLVRDEYNASNADHSQKPLFVSTNGVEKILDRLLIKARIRVRTAREHRYLHPVMRSHGLRKFSITQMKKAKVDFNDREALVGHRRSRGLDLNYDRTTEEERLQEFLKAMDLLTISPENRLRKQVAEQQHTIQVRLADKDKQIAELQLHVKEMSDILKYPEKLRELMESG